MLNYVIGQKLKFIFGAILVFALIIFGYIAPLAAAPDDVRVAKLKKEAEKEGKVVIYTSMNASDSMVVVEKFKKKYPFLKVDLYRLNNTNLFNRWLAERKAVKNMVDVVTSKGDSIYIMQKMGLLSRYLSPEREFYNERFKDKEGYWTDVYPTIHCVVYNTRLVAPHEVPVTYQDLLKPQWKGKIGYNPNNYTWPEAVMQIMGKQKGLKFLEALAQQNPVVRVGGMLHVMLTAAGEIAMAVPINDNNVESVKANGAPVDWARLKPYYGDLHPIALAANAPHPNASKLFIDYALSQEGQEVVAELGKIPARKGIKSTRVSSEEINTIDPALGDNIDYYRKLIDQLFVKK